MVIPAALQPSSAIQPSILGIHLALSDARICHRYIGAMRFGTQVCGGSKQLYTNSRNFLAKCIKRSYYYDCHLFSIPCDRRWGMLECWNSKDGKKLCKVNNKQMNMNIILNVKVFFKLVKKYRSLILIL